MMRALVPCLTWATSLTLWLLAAGSALAAPLIVNEFNAVGSSDYLNGGTAACDGDSNCVDPPADPYFGRVAGNGGDWIELIVIADHLDIRGWQLDICEGVVCDDLLVFSSDGVWSDLRAGTVITVAEDEPTDLSFAMGMGDWWMNVRAHSGGTGTYITAANFPVSHNDWNVRILDDLGAPVFGPIGEHVPVTPSCSPPQDDLNSGEIFRLEQEPTALIDPCFETLNDWEDGVLSTFGQENLWNSGFASQSFANLRGLTGFPDRDGDGIPDDGDHSGTAGDAPCTGGNTTGCDDNCAGIQNASQTDIGGPGGPDGQGDACQCGDSTGDDDTTAADVLELRELHVGLRSDLTVPDRCSVHSTGQCNLADLVVLARTVANPALTPGLAPSCQVASLHTDQSEFMFDPDRLIDIEIEIQQVDWDTIRNQKIVFADLCTVLPIPSPYTNVSADVTVDGQPLPNSAVRKKGSLGSESATIPSLKVKFDEYVGGQQLNSLDRMTLNNNKQDPAYVSQCLAYKQMTDAGAPAPRCNFAHVTVTVVNGGSSTVEVDRIYTNVEPINDPFLRRHFGSDSDQGRLYEGAFADFWSGNYRDSIEPKTPSAAADMTEIDALAAVLENEGLSDAARLAAIEAIVDVPDFNTFWAAEGMAGHWDGYRQARNNFYFYVDPADGLIRFVPWGADQSWGLDNGGCFNASSTHCEAIVAKAALARRLYEITTAQADYLTEVQRQLDDVFDEPELHAEIDRMELLIQPVTGLISSNIAQVETYIDAHRVAVTGQLASPPTPLTSQPPHHCDP